MFWCVCVCTSAEWQVSELSAALTHSPPAVFNQYHSEFLQPAHMCVHTLTHAQTWTRTHTRTKNPHITHKHTHTNLASYQGNTKDEQLHTPPWCVNRAHILSHTHTHIKGECVYLLVCFFSLGLSVQHRVVVINSCPVFWKSGRVEYQD